MTEEIELTNLDEVGNLPARIWPAPPRPPSFQDLVERCGGYYRISPEAWAEHDAAMAKWRVDRTNYYVELQEESRRIARKHAAERKPRR